MAVPECAARTQRGLMYKVPVWCAFRALILATKLPQVLLRSDSPWAAGLSNHPSAITLSIRVRLPLSGSMHPATVAASTSTASVGERQRGRVAVLLTSYRRGLAGRYRHRTLATVRAPLDRPC